MAEELRWVADAVPYPNGLFPRMVRFFAVTVELYDRRLHQANPPWAGPKAAQFQAPDSSTSQRGEESAQGWRRRTFYLCSECPDLPEGQQSACAASDPSSWKIIALGHNKMFRHPLEHACVRFEFRPPGHPNRQLINT